MFMINLIVQCWFHSQCFTVTRTHTQPQTFMFIACIRPICLAILFCILSIYFHSIIAFDQPNTHTNSRQRDLYDIINVSDAMNATKLAQKMFVYNVDIKWVNFFLFFFFQFNFFSFCLFDLKVVHWRSTDLARERKKSIETYMNGLV